MKINSFKIICLSALMLIIFVKSYPYFEQFNICVHNPVTLAQAPNVITKYTGAFSIMESPSLSALNDGLTAGYLDTRWANLWVPDKVQSIAIGYHISKWIGLGIAGTMIDYISVYKGIKGNISFHIPFGIYPGVNINYLTSKYDSTIESTLTYDIGLLFRNGLSVAGLRHDAAFGISVNNYSNDASMNTGSDWITEFGYEFTDEIGIIPVLTGVSIQINRTYRVIANNYEGTGIDYLTLGGEISILDLLNLRGGYTRGIYDANIIGIHNYFEDGRTMGLWTYGFGINYQFNNLWALPYEITASINYSSAPGYFDYWLGFNDPQVSGQSISIEFKVVI